jgi:CBS domain-containing membrane protein
VESVETVSEAPEPLGWRGAGHLRALRHRARGGGVCPQRHPVMDIVLSWVGGFLGIVAVTIPNHYLHLGQAANIMLIGSFGASAVLIYGLPRAELAQPRNLIGGHFFSALAGVAAYKLLGDAHLDVAAGVAVATSIALMHLTRTLHPPGGATALIAVIGGDAMHRLGFTYAFAPVLAGALLMLAVAVVVNNLHDNKRRHYPLYWW